MLGVQAEDKLCVCVYLHIYIEREREREWVFSSPAFSASQPRTDHGLEKV
jgi:hypothetical protein